MDLSKEWNFITKEIHKENPSKNNLLKREVLFALQVMLSKTDIMDIGNYRRLKNIYLNK